jgi:hypothetical protein
MQKGYRLRGCRLIRNLNRKRTGIRSIMELLKIQNFWSRWDNANAQELP